MSRRKMSIESAVKKALEKYQCLQCEDFYIEVTESYVGLVWHNYMDRYINLYKVRCVAKFLRSYTDLPIIDSFGVSY